MQPHVLILGAGPAGVAAAYKLRQRDKARVTVVEQRRRVGGNAGSFTWNGQRLDYGSHRLHPACEPAILADIQTFLGSDLLDRPRHGRILLCGKWIHFPLKPLDLLLRLDRRFALGVLCDMIATRLGAATIERGSFTSVLQATLGPTICHHFYFPYAEKIWGRDPRELSAVQARRRVSANSFPKLLRHVISQFSGLKRGRSGHFYYPRHGFGQISEAYAAAARAHGAEFLLGSTVKRLEQPQTERDHWTVLAERDGRHRTVQADYVWSTLPVSRLVHLLSPEAPAAILDAAKALSYRAMLLVYLQLDMAQFTPYDAYYFPGATIAMTRLSEPKNYAAGARPPHHTTLCAELPCAAGDAYWRMSDAALAQRVADDLARAGLALPRPPVAVQVKRLRQAYPIYAQGYERHFEVLDAWIESLPRLLSYGRQGLFAHDNTHHALAMAYAAATCFQAGAFDIGRWHVYRRIFETHVVED